MSSQNDEPIPVSKRNKSMSLKEKVGKVGNVGEAWNQPAVKLSRYFHKILICSLCHSKASCMLISEGKGNSPKQAKGETPWHRQSPTSL